MFQLSDYHYDLPEDRIAQHPAPDRSRSRLLHLIRQTRAVSHHRFDDLPVLLGPDDLLVVNDTRVIPARLTGRKDTGGKVEVLIIDYAAGMTHLAEHGVFQCDCLIRASRRPGPGAQLLLGADIQARVVRHDGPVSTVAFHCGDDFPTALERAGQVPLPPYIRRQDQDPADKDHYQTVYARHKGAVAAPTAGLHFTGDLMARLAARGIEMASITLHVGYGTFVPVKVDDIRDHDIHQEFFDISEEAARTINRAREDGRRVVAVGTTVVRTLEYAARASGRVVPGHGLCDLFIYPGFKFRMVDAMITNFHLPESTLLMLVSAFHDREDMLRVYNTAVDHEYRFFSYGDAMLIE